MFLKIVFISSWSVVSNSYIFVIWLCSITGIIPFIPFFDIKLSGTIPSLLASIWQNLLMPSLFFALAKEASMFFVSWLICILLNFILLLANRSSMLLKLKFGIILLLRLVNVGYIWFIIKFGISNLSFFD